MYPETKNDARITPYKVVTIEYLENTWKYTYLLRSPRISWQLHFCMARYVVAIHRGEFFYAAILTPADAVKHPLRNPALDVPETTRLGSRLVLARPALRSPSIPHLQTRSRRTCGSPQRTLRQRTRDSCLSAGISGSAKPTTTTGWWFKVMSSGRENWPNWRTFVVWLPFGGKCYVRQPLY